MVQVCWLCPNGWAYIFSCCSSCADTDILLVMRTVAGIIFAYCCLSIWNYFSLRPLLFALDGRTLHLMAEKVNLDLMAEPVKRITGLEDLKRFFTTMAGSALLLSILLLQYQAMTFRKNQLAFGRTNHNS